MKKILPIIFCFAAVLTGCVKEYRQSGGNTGDGINQIRLNIGGQTEVITRGDANDNECEISHVDLLVFDGVSKKYKSGERIIGADISGTDKTKPRFATALPIVDGDKIVVVCNAANPSLPAFTASDEEEKINELFTFPAYDSYNPSDPNQSGKMLPMSGSMIWGEDSECPVYRSVSKVELVLADDLKTEFQADLRWGIENFPTLGNIYSSDGESDIPSSGLSYYSIDSQEIYPAETADRVTAVYIPEYNSSVKAKGIEVLSNKFNADRVCLIVRTGNSRYYRIDLYDQEGEAFYDIGRNCHYKVKITKIHNEGYLTREEALANPASNIEYDIEVTDRTTAITLTNGQYALQVSHDEVHIFDDKAIAHDLFKVGYSLASGVTFGSSLTNSITPSEDLTLSVSGQKVTGAMQSVRATFKAGKTEGTVTVRLGNLVKVVRVRVYGQLPAAVGTNVGNYFTAATTEGISWLESDNECDITENGTSFTLIHRENEKSVVRRFHVNIFREYDDGTVGIAKVAGKQAVSI